MLGILLGQINYGFGKKLEEMKIKQEIESEEIEEEASKVSPFDKRAELEKIREEREQRQRQRSCRRKELQVLKLAFMTLFVIADIAVLLWGNRKQAVLYCASLAPWAVFACFPHLRKLRPHVEAIEIDEHGKLIRRSTVTFLQRFLAKAQSLGISLFQSVCFMMAITAAGTNRQLAMMMLAGDVACKMLDNCEMHLLFLKMDAFFDRDSENCDSDDAPFVMDDKTLDKIKKLLENNDNDKGD